MTKRKPSPKTKLALVKRGDESPSPKIRKRRPRSDNNDIRRREVEDLYLNGYRPQEIHAMLLPRHGVAAGTIRNDIVAIRKLWTEIIIEEEPSVRETYVGKLYAVRRYAMREGVRDYRLAYEIDRQIARVLGLKLTADSQQITITVEEARTYVAHICDLVAQHVRHADDRAALLAAIEAEGGVAS
jgi:hypothetical protein